VHTDDGRTDERTDHKKINVRSSNETVVHIHSAYIALLVYIYITTAYSRLWLCHLAIAYKALQNTYSSPLVCKCGGWFLPPRSSNTCMW
jgi:hypothetical protein